MSFTHHDFVNLLICASESGITDICIHPGRPIFWRRWGGKDEPLLEQIPTIEEIRFIANEIVPEYARESLTDMLTTSHFEDRSVMEGVIYYRTFRTGDFDTSSKRITFYCTIESWKYRVTFVRVNGTIAMYICPILRNIPDLSTLNKKLQLFIQQKEIPAGLYLIAGKIGSGKTTAIATMIQGFKQYHSDSAMHIVKIETYPEYTHPEGIHHIDSYSMYTDYSVSALSTTAIDIMRVRPHMVFVDTAMLLDDFMGYDNKTAVLSLAVSIPTFITMNIEDEELAQLMFQFDTARGDPSFAKMFSKVFRKIFVVKKEDWHDGKHT